MLCATMKKSRTTAAPAKGGPRSERECPLGHRRHQQAVGATVAGIAIAIPIGIGAARNLAPRAIDYYRRGIVAVARSFQEVLYAIFLRRHAVYRTLLPGLVSLPPLRFTSATI